MLIFLIFIFVRVQNNLKINFFTQVYESIFMYGSTNYYPQLEIHQFFKLLSLSFGKATSWFCGVFISKNKNDTTPPHYNSYFLQRCAAFSTAILNHRLKKLVSIVKVTFQLVLTIFPYFNQSSHLNTSTIYSIQYPVDISKTSFTVLQIKITNQMTRVLLSSMYIYLFL